MQSNRLLYTIIGITLAIVSWVWQNTYQATFTKLAEIEQSIAELKLDVVRVQGTILTDDRVREIVATELARRHVQ